MELITYIRKPFTVEAVEITDENIEEVAGIIGELREKNGERYIAVNRRVVPNISRAMPGWFLTRMGDNYRCYSPKVFTDQFTEHEPGTGYFFDEEQEDEASLTLADETVEAQAQVINNVFDNPILLRTDTVASSVLVTD